MFVVWEDLLGVVLRGVTMYSEELKGKLLQLNLLLKRSFSPIIKPLLLGTRDLYLFQRASSVSLF